MTFTDDSRLIDRWFPVSAVDEACKTTVGSGLIEKAIFTWFASRPLAQARAAALTSLLADGADQQHAVERAIRDGDRQSIIDLATTVRANYEGKPPVVLDIFSGRGIIPLEAARAGAIAIGLDLSPVATLAGRLLADYSARNWDSEPSISFATSDHGNTISMSLGDRLVSDVEAYLREVGNRVSKRMAVFYPKNVRGGFPWGYLWSITIPCDECKRRFPLLGSLVLRYPFAKNKDLGQSLRIVASDSGWSLELLDGPPVQEPTYSSATRADGKKKKGKTARCVFCGYIHTLESVKAKGAAEEYSDTLLLVVDITEDGKKFFRLPTEAERTASESVSFPADHDSSPYSVVPNERISPGNVHTVMASGYGFRKFGDLMSRRQTLSFVYTVAAIREIAAELRLAGISGEYIKALAGFAAANLCRRLRYSTRGVRLRPFGDANGTKNNNVGVGDLFTNESKLNFQFDWLETGLGEGSATWASTSVGTVRAIRKLKTEQCGKPARFHVASATAIPLRDSSVDVVVTDPPYYDMIEYADASDLFYVWLKRTLYDIEPDLFDLSVQQPDGLQDKNDEIIVRRVHEPNRTRHDTAFYEAMLAKSFSETRRVLKPNGHLVVMFGHSDPDAWRRLLGALQSAGFVVTSAWPSRTESANTGVASIKVTVTIGCRVAAANRPAGIGSEVDRDWVIAAVSERVRQWENERISFGGPADGFVRACNGSLWPL